MPRQHIAVASTGRALTITWVCISLAFAWVGVAPWQALYLAPSDTPQPKYEPDGALATGSLATELLEPESETHNNKDNPLVDCMIGVFLLPMAFALLWLNEGHAVRMNLMLAFLHRKVKSVEGAQAHTDDQRKPVFVTGEGRTEDTLTLEEWGDLTAPANSVKLRAMSFMHQWEEEKDDNTTKYKKRWVHHQVNSDSFQNKGYVNPDFPVQPTTVELAKVTLGSFVLSMKMLGKFQNYKPCELDGHTLAAIRNSPRMAGYGSPQPTTFSIPSSLSDIGSAAAYYFSKGCGSQSSPDVGDLMVVFQYVPCGPMSALGVQVPSSDHQTARVLVPGTRCEVGGRAAEIVEVTPPPRPVQIHYTHGRSSFEWKEISEVQPIKHRELWQHDPSHPWTFVPVQYTQDARDRSIGGLLRANTSTINVGDEVRQTLLGDNEGDIYLEDVRSVLGHLTHGATQATKTFSCNPVGMASAFLKGSSPDEVCLAYPGILTFDEAMSREKELERQVNNGVRLFGTVLMYVCILMILRPVTWLLSFFWVFGTVLILVLKMGACLATCFCSGFTMAGAWAYYRPIFSVPVVCALIVILYFFHMQQDAI